jgi:hypothetical protein
MRTLIGRRGLILAALLVGGLVAGGIAAGPRLARRPRITIHPRDELKVQAHSPAPGVLAFSARGMVRAHVRDAVFWWRVEITRHTGSGPIARYTGSGLQLAWAREYDDMPFYTKARKGTRVPHDLAEQRVNLPAGIYDVFVAMREDVAEADVDGNIIAAGMDREGRLVVVDVK